MLNMDEWQKGFLHGLTFIVSVFLVPVFQTDILFRSFFRDVGAGAFLLFSTFFCYKRSWLRHFVDISLSFPP